MAQTTWRILTLLILFVLLELLQAVEFYTRSIRILSAFSSDSVAFNLARIGIITGIYKRSSIMGASQSSQQRRPGVFPPQSQYLIRVGNDFPHFVLCFRRPLTATLILHNKEILQTLEETVRKRWPTSLKKVVHANEDGSAEVQLAEDTFRTLADLLDSWKPELIFNFKRFLCAAFTDFKSAGWRVSLSTNTWTRYPALSTLIFEKRSPSPQAQIFAISLSFEGNVLLVNASERLKEIVRELIKKWYPPGLLETVNYGNDIRYRLSGSPWTAWPGDQSIRMARRLLLECFRRVYEIGCKFYCSMNTADFGDCIFFEESSSTDSSTSPLSDQTIASSNLSSDHSANVDSSNQLSGQSATITDQKLPCNSSTDQGLSDQPHFMCLTFYNENKIHLIAEPVMMNRVEQIVTDAVKTYWHLGLKSVMKCPDDQSYEITLKGTPFVAVPECDSPKLTPDDSASWQVRYFLCNLFQSLSARGGWKMEGTFDAHRKNYDSATYVFKQRPNGQTVILQHACIAFDRLNLVRVVNDVNGDLAPVVIQTVTSAWSKGIVRQMQMDDVKGTQLILAGQPWFTCLDGLYTNSLDGIAAQTLVCLLYSELAKSRWRIIASASTCCLTLGRGRHKQRATADTWILVKSVDSV